MNGRGGEGECGEGAGVDIGRLWRPWPGRLWQPCPPCWGRQPSLHVNVHVHVLFTFTFLVNTFSRETTASFGEEIHSSSSR